MLPQSLLETQKLSGPPPKLSDYGPRQLLSVLLPGVALIAEIIWLLLHDEITKPGQFKNFITSLEDIPAVVPISFLLFIIILAILLGYASRQVLFGLSGCLLNRASPPRLTSGSAAVHNKKTGRDERLLTRLCVAVLVHGRVKQTINETISLNEKYNPELLITFLKRQPYWDASGQQLMSGTLDYCKSWAAIKQPQLYEGLATVESEINVLFASVIPAACVSCILFAAGVVTGLPPAPDLVTSFGLIVGAIIFGRLAYSNFVLGLKYRRNEPVSALYMVFVAQTIEQEEAIIPADLDVNPLGEATVTSIEAAVKRPAEPKSTSNRPGNKSNSGSYPSG